MPAEPPVESPATLTDAYRLLAEGDGWRPVAGGTDLLVQITGELGPPPDRVLDIWSLDELRGISLDGDELVIGALTTYTDLRQSALVGELVPALAAASATIGAAQIQNRGTVGGNLVNASPAGDTLPIWLATDTQIVLGSAGGERSVAAAEFFTGYRQTARRDDELVLRVRVPLLPRRHLRFRKIGTRRAQAISKVVLGGEPREHSDQWPQRRSGPGVRRPPWTAGTPSSRPATRPSRPSRRRSRPSTMSARPRTIECW
jgi:CO/xanthine dehydrogenase FAD-binding subunit